eukprot:COSAG01_NODE_27018_length_696_cov_4.594640_1_plen_64_part_01
MVCGYVRAVTRPLQWPVLESSHAPFLDRVGRGGRGGRGVRVAVTGRFFIRHMNVAGASGASLSC